MSRDKCRACDGTGRAKYHLLDNPWGWMQDCSVCRGRGHYLEMTEVEKRIYRDGIFPLPPSSFVRHKDTPDA